MNDTIIREIVGIAVATTALTLEPMHLGSQATFFAAFGAVAGSFIRRRNNRKRYRFFADSGSFIFTAMISFFTAILFAEPMYIYLTENWLAPEYKIANIYNGIHFLFGAMVYPFIEVIVVHIPNIYRKKLIERAKKT